MQKKNPYDDYDVLDTSLDDFDDYDTDKFDLEENFSYEKDDFDLEGNFDYVEDDLPPYAPAPDSDPFPKTMVRQRPLVQGDTRQEQTSRKSQGPILRRKRGRETGRRQTVDNGYAYQGYPAQPVEAPRPQRAQRPRRRRSHGCLVTILVAIALIVGAYWVVAHPIDERLAFTPREQATVDGTLSWSIPGTPYYVLALGSDAQEGTTGERSDTMILMRVDLLGGKLTMLSIPRDTRVEIDGYGAQKINAAYAFGGAGGAVRAVSKLTGANINHVAVIHIDELAGLVDYLGGVTVNVPEAAYDPEHTGIDIPSGMQTLDGETAVAWARTRYGYTRGDFQRQEDQRILMTAIMNRMLSLSPREMPGALDRVGDLIGTDLRCYNLAPLLLRFKLANPVIYSSSVPSTTETIDGVSYVIADEAALADMMRTINAGGDPGDPVN